MNELSYILQLGYEQVFNLCSQKRVFFPPGILSKVHPNGLAKKALSHLRILDFSTGEDHSDPLVRN